MIHRSICIASLVLAVTLACWIPSSAIAAPDSDYHMQVDALLTPRTAEDGGTIWWALPRGKVTVFAGGKLRRVYARGFSVCCGAAGVQMNRLESTSMALIERPLTIAERRRFGSVRAWIDGDVLVAHPSNAACTTGLSLAGARAALRGTTTPFSEVYAPVGVTGTRELLFGLFSNSTDVRVYGANVRLVTEGSAIATVAASSTSVAAVAWSAARQEIAAGTVCAIPINGHLPDETSLRNRTYPASVHVHIVYGKAHYMGWRSYVRRWYTAFAASPRVRTVLLNSRGREVLRP